ncbi:Copia protein [Trachymyrmex septentrionalis]|uniref:Copia protein n=1 Tax=Trachymyrmex septentrionalis TaxID=34720 RepID=A0A151JTB5_9HYME|nr:Copia protein [Trachymyrmex septentrionalis]
MTEEIRIQIFDGKNYNIWKKRILMYLKWKKCDEVATRARLTTDNETTWNEENLKAMNYIYSGITNDQLEFVSEEETAYGIMKKLDSIYTRESTAIQICVRNKLEKIKLKDYEESSTFFTEFEKLINELKGAGATVTEREKLNYMLRTLPNSLSYIGDLIDAVKESDQTCEFLKNKITMWETREKNDNGQSQSKKSAFKSERKDLEKTCFGCGKPGHIKANYKNTWSRGNSRRISAGGGAYEQGGAH